MNAKVFLLCFVSAWTASAADTPANFSSSTARPEALSRSDRLQNFFTAKRDAPVIPLGKSDFVFSGPLASGFRRLPPVENLSRTRRFLRLPLIRLFVPGPMERPPESGPKYFAWKSEECSMPWIKAASRAKITKGAESSANLDLSRTSLHQ